MLSEFTVHLIIGILLFLSGYFLGASTPKETRKQRRRVSEFKIDKESIETRYAASHPESYLAMIENNKELERRREALKGEPIDSKLARKGHTPALISEYKDWLKDLEEMSEELKQCQQGMACWHMKP